MEINRNELESIVLALNKGLVPNRGIKHLMVGREKLLSQFDSDLKIVSEGKSMTKLIIGKYGTGKTHTKATLVHKAHNKGFVTSNVDFSPVRKLYNREGLSRALYTDIIKNLKTKTSTKNTIYTIVEDWLSQLIEKMDERGFDIDLECPKFIEEFKKVAKEEIYNMDNGFGTENFAEALTKYIEGYVTSNEQLQKDAIKWISAEYPTRTESKRALGIGSIINDTNYYDYLKVLCEYLILAGYKGLLINFDEAVNLYKITNKQSRDKNYEMILRIFNDTTQGEVKSLFITFGGTPTFLEDDFKGLFSYGALKRRLQESKFSLGEKDYTQPVIKLEILPVDKQFILLSKIKDIYSMYYECDLKINQEDIKKFLKNNYTGLRAKSITIGEIIRDFVAAINTIRNNPDINRDSLFGDSKTNNENKKNILSRFGIDE